MQHMTNHQIITKYRVSNKIKFLVITTNISVVKTLLLPLTYIFRERDNFTLLYRFATLRSYDKLRYDLSRRGGGSNYQTILIPTKTMRPLLRIFFLFKMQFHFPGTIVLGKRVDRATVIQMVRAVYAFLRMGHYNKITYIKLYDRFYTISIKKSTFVHEMNYKPINTRSCTDQTGHYRFRNDNLVFRGCFSRRGGTHFGGGYGPISCVNHNLGGNSFTKAVL